MERIAVIGLGQMGGAIATRLHSQGLGIIGYDSNAATCREFAARGIAVAQSIADAAGQSGVVLTSLPNSPAVQAVWTGADGLASCVGPGTLCVELSSIDPQTMQAVGRILAARGAEVVDCPVSGSPQEALGGKLVLIAGGEPAAVERARPIVTQLGETVRYAGPIGTAKVVKIVNNMMSMANILAASEAFALGERAGVNPEVLLDILSVSGGRSSQFLKRFPWAVKGDFAPRFKMELGEKDLSLGVDLGRAVGMPTPVASLTRELYALAMAQGLRGRDIVALLQMYEQWGRATEG
ncbi:MAG: NAD(P)-dependent oxidoreductase [Burkholderiaceae bacterium]|nr:NAD(P)-dependent oxidoreductase [Burkholderiaceae bacterium]MEB2351181.1 NAD(P)-dependent oxidoreductase [Burkholderiaceae bacterium]